MEFGIKVSAIGQSPDSATSPLSVPYSRMETDLLDIRPVRELSLFYKWIDRKAMPAHKVGSLWKFQKVEIDNWVISGQASDRRATHAENR